MFYTQDRNKLRQFYADVWQRFRQGQSVDAMESVIAEVIQMHPEYHQVVENPEKYMDKDWLPELGETNPYLHMGMHLAIHEQVSTNRPAGIADVHTRLSLKLGPHEAEHRMMDALGKALWEAQRFGRMPDEAQYLEELRNLL